MPASTAESMRLSELENVVEALKRGPTPPAGEIARLERMRDELAAKVPPKDRHTQRLVRLVRHR